jgi:trehalose 6-phosphate phosphatase
MASPGAHDEALERLLEPLLGDPARAAVLLDVDGTLAPIVDDPAEAAVPEETRGALGKISERYGLVACVSGRQAAEARRLVGVDSLTYIGNHGLERLEPGAVKPTFDPDLEGRESDAQAFVELLDDLDGLRIEDKGPIVALHWRQAKDEEAAVRAAERIASVAESRELSPRWGRKVLEIRPDLPVSKGAALMTLLREQRPDSALYAGDDLTDVDAFQGLRQLEEGGELKTAACIGVVSDEGPPELEEEADLLVDGPSGFRAVLDKLAEAS